MGFSDAKLGNTPDNVGPVTEMRTLQLPRTCVCLDTIMVMPRSETIIDM